MRSILLMVVGFVLMLPCSEAHAGDACVEFTCRNDAGTTVKIQGAGATLITIGDAGNQAHQAPMIGSLKNCTCTNQVHTPQPNEIASVLSAEIVKAIADEVAKEIKKMQDEHTKRIEDIYKTFAEERKKTDEQIKLLTEMVKKLNATPTPRAKAAPPRPQGGAR